MLKIKHGNLAFNVSTSLLLVTKKKAHYTKNLRANVYWNCLLQVLHAQFKRKHSLNISSERKEKHSPSFIQIFITNTK
jgi:hypothetical protein